MYITSLFLVFISFDYCIFGLLEVDSAKIQMSKLTNINKGI